MEQFTSFVQEALEFLSLLRASEKERFESQKKFMDETTKILKDLADSIQKNNTLIKNTLEELKGSVNDELKKITDNIGLENLTQAISALESSVDLLQRGSTILEYKYTVQKTRDILDELQKRKGQIEPGVPVSKTSPSFSSAEPLKVSPPPFPTVGVERPPQKPITSPPPSPAKEEPPKKQSEPPLPRIPKPVTTPTAKETPKKSDSETPKFDPLSSAMGTRSGQTPRRVVNLKKPSGSKIVDSKGEPIEIDTRSDEDK
ncbi:MAG: hypothetical protein LUQ65_07760 [Candidatus Helarchaeota archaeon]|nr:hypothetical protein [Candidatus Helarchaeota archaeon]